MSSVGLSEQLKSLRKESTILHILVCLLIVYLICRDLPYLNYIAVLNDEFGYWGTAASIAGYDWSELMAETPYYAYGYSLLLIPLIVLLPTPIMWYKAAIILNVLMLIGTYFISYNIGRKIFPDSEDRVVMMVSALVAIYPGNISYAQVAWSETLQYFLVWVITYFVVKLDENFSLLKVVAVNLLAIYLYSVHNRNIGVIAILLLCNLFIIIKHQKNLFLYSFSVILVLLGYFAFKWIRQYEVAVLWGNSSVSEVNNLVVSGTTITNYLTKLLGDFIRFLGSVYGKLFYLLLATGFTFGLAIIGFVKETINNIRQKHFFSDHYISKFWCVTILVIMWLLSSLETNDWQGRKDLIVYARYMEHAIGPTLFMGIMYTLNHLKKQDKTVLISVALFMVGFHGVYKTIGAASRGFISICAPVMGAYYDNTNTLADAFGWIAITFDVFFVMILLFSYIKRQKLRQILIFCLFLLFFSIVGIKADTFVIRARNEFESGTIPVYNELLAIDNSTLYYVKDVENDQFSVNPKYLQFLVPQSKIHLIDVEELDQIGESEILVLIHPKDSETRDVLMERNAMELASTHLLLLYNINN